MRRRGLVPGISATVLWPLVSRAQQKRMPVAPRRTWEVVRIAFYLAELSGGALAVLIFAYTSCPGQTLPLDAGPYRLLRYEQTCRTIADVAMRTATPLGFAELGPTPDHCISFGGEIKERYEHYTNLVFGKRTIANEDYLLSRIMLHSDLHLGKNLRAFLQIGRWDTLNKNLVVPVDRDYYDFAQGFVDLSIAAEPLETITLRSGRQEMPLGSGRFVGIREGANTRQSFDGFRAFATWHNRARIDAFLTRPTVIRRGSFDDGPDPHQVFGGLYGTLPVDPTANFNIDGYYYMLSTKGAPFTPGPPRNRVQTIGMRLWGGVDPWDYDVDVLAQFGTQDRSRIRAGGIATKVGYSLPQGQAWWRPRLVLEANYFSGNRNPGSGEVNTFNPLFPKALGGYDGAHETSANLIDIYPSLKLHPAPNVALEFGVDMNWRASTRDFVYVTPFFPLAGTATVPGRYISTNYVVQASWAVTSAVYLYTTLVHLAAGPAITNARGKSMDYATVVVRVRF